jgi:AraC-like DNA-binding protein
MKLLSVGDETVSQVAEHTGFGTAGYFIKAFKKKVSLTPNEYKKSLKKLGK